MYRCFSKIKRYCSFRLEFSTMVELFRASQAEFWGKVPLSTRKGRQSRRGSECPLNCRVRMNLRHSCKVFNGLPTATQGIP
jgi:hypothetical protein